jgi:hypothetical protein
VDSAAQQARFLETHRPLFLCSLLSVLLGEQKMLTVYQGQSEGSPGSVVAVRTVLRARQRVRLYYIDAILAKKRSTSQLERVVHGASFHRRTSWEKQLNTDVRCETTGSDWWRG